MPILVLSGSIVRPLEEGAPAFAHVNWSNPLAGEAIDLEVARPAKRLVMYSGWLGEEGDARAGHFTQDFRTWTPAAWEALDRFCDAARPELERHTARLAFRPHARHVLADPQACLHFLNRRDDQPFDVLLDAAAFLTPDMLDRAEDHLRRAFEALAGHPAVPAAVLTGLEPAGNALRAAPLTRGVLDPDLLLDLARRHAADLPWILLEEDLEAQTGLLA